MISRYDFVLLIVILLFNDHDDLLLPKLHILHDSQFSSFCVQMSRSFLSLGKFTKGNFTTPHFSQAVLFNQNDGILTRAFFDAFLSASLGQS